MSFKSTLFKVVLGLILTCLAFIATAVFYWDHTWGCHSSFGLNVSKDSELIAMFQAHRETFAKLQRMATEDAQHGLYLNAPYFGEGSKFDKSRQKEYEALISRIYPGLHVSIDAREKGISFTFAGGGFSAIGPEWGKGIKYEPMSFEVNGVPYQNPYVGVILTNLDNARTLNTGTTYIRQIDPNWFLFYYRGN